MFNRRWWLSTLLVLAAMGVMGRLGLWQLDRLEQRRARNAQIAHQLTLPPLALTGSEALPDDLTILKSRVASVQGEFDFSRQVALTFQNWQGSPGIHLITPLMIEGSSPAVLVDRGWIPLAEATPAKWAQFDEPGLIELTGFIRLSETLPPDQNEPNLAESAATTPQTEWFRVDIEAIQAQLPYDLLPVYIQQSPPAAGRTDLPYRNEVEFDLSDGPHLGYAGQWFIFALILGIGYVHYVRKQSAKSTGEGN